MSPLLAGGLPGSRLRAGPARHARPIAPPADTLPDPCRTLGEPNEAILRQPPFICIEVLSPEDRWPPNQQRIDDYLAMGVPYVWVLDPAAKTAYSVTRTTGTNQVTDVLKTLNPSVELPLSEIFA
mgnify:CR=1 FL=1